MKLKKNKKENNTIVATATIVLLKPNRA